MRKQRSKLVITSAIITEHVYEFKKPPMRAKLKNSTTKPITRSHGCIECLWVYGTCICTTVEIYPPEYSLSALSARRFRCLIIWIFLLTHHFLASAGFYQHHIRQVSRPLMPILWPFAISYNPHIEWCNASLKLTTYICAHYRDLKIVNYTSDLAII